MSQARDRRATTGMAECQPFAIDRFSPGFKPTEATRPTMDPSRYDEVEALGKYLWTYHQEVFSDFERAVDSAYISRGKYEHGSGVPMPRQPVYGEQEWDRSMREACMYGNTTIEQALSDGWMSFRRRATQRLLDGQDICGIWINRCPSCRGVARTPAARQCRWCGHDWH